MRYDQVFVAGPVVERFIGAESLNPIDQKALSNKRKLDSTVLEVLAQNDPGNAHAILYMWKTVGIGDKQKQVHKRIQDAPVNSLDMLFNLERSKNFIDCGIGIIESSGKIINIGLNYLVPDPLSRKKQNTKQA